MNTAKGGCRTKDRSRNGEHPASAQLPSLPSAERPPREKGEAMAGKFVIKKGSTGKFRFNLVASNGQVVATSEAYNTKAAAMGGVRSVKKIAADADVEDQTTKDGSGTGVARKAAAAAKKSAGTAKSKVAKR